jgi:hypothetical protein
MELDEIEGLGKEMGFEQPFGGGGKSALAGLWRLARFLDGKLGQR